jgi:dihydroxy-acid dehydratase
MAETYTALRSHAWFSGNGKGSFIHRSWMKNQGLDPSMFDGRPVVGICNTWSELTPCNAHLRELAEHVRRGIIAAGGLPLEFPVMSLGESNMRPTAMMFRNLASMEVEETIRANPLDGVGLRQDYAGTGNGGSQLRPTDHCCLGWSDDCWPLLREATRFGHGCLAAQ